MYECLLRDASLVKKNKEINEARKYILIMSILLSNDISRCSIKALSSGSLLSFGPLWWVGDTGCLGQLHWNHISSHHTMNRIPVCVCVLSSQSCTTLFGPVDCSPLVSSVRGIFQTRILSGVPFPTPGDLPNSWVEPTSLASPALVGRFFTTGTTWEVQIGFLFVFKERIY